MISAIILGAGQSRRMRQPKLLLPWGDVTVLEQVISIFAGAGIDDILVITGGAREQVEEVVSKCSKAYPVRSAYNKEYENGEMLSSIQCGLRVLADGAAGAAMIGLGDQPQVQERTVRSVAETYLQTASPLVVPSYQMRRGHPWLVARSWWNDMLGMSRTQTPREFLNAHAEDIYYVEMQSPTILADLDTPEEYRQMRPQ